jgi:hypothetical protein
MKHKRLNEEGHEVLSSKPMSLPSGMKRPETTAETIQRLVRGELSRVAARQGAETFEEADDFDVGDDLDPSTPYEMVFDPVLGRDVTPADFVANEKRYKDEYLQKQKEADIAANKADLMQRVKKWPFFAKRRPKADDEPKGESKVEPKGETEA